VATEAKERQNKAMAVKYLQPILTWHQKTTVKVGFVRLLWIAFEAVRRLFKLPASTIIQRQGLKFQIDYHEAIDFCLFLTGEYEPDLMNSYPLWCRSGDVILEIGANRGAHTLPLAKYLGPTGRLFAIEPTREAFERLQKNRSINPSLQNIIEAYQLFMGAGEETKLPSAISASWSVSVPVSHPSRSTIDQGLPCSTEGAKVSTIDQFMQDLKCQQLNTIKLDVDGNELVVLRGGEKTIAQFRPTLVIELAPIHFSVRQDSFSDLIDWLSAHQYQLYDLKGRSLPMESKLLEEQIPWGSFLNVLAKPLIQKMWEKS